MSPSIAVLRCVSVALLAVCAGPVALAQPEIVRGLDQSPTRVLQIVSSEGTVSLRRGGNTESLKPGFLVFSEDRVMLAPRARAELQLARYGEINLAAQRAEAALSFERLPFSSWAVDLETRMRLEGGLMRVRWMRPGDAADWPLSVDVDRWSADLGNGEFLFKRDGSSATVCVLSGKLDLVGAESGSGRTTPAAGSCVELRAGDAPREVALVAEDWSDLRADLAVAATSPDSSRSLQLPPAAPQQPARVEPVVTPPPVAAADRPALEAPVVAPPPPVPATEPAMAVAPPAASVSVVVPDAAPVVAEPAAASVAAATESPAVTEVAPPPVVVEAAPAQPPAAAPPVQTAVEPTTPPPPADAASAATAVTATPAPPPVSAAPVVAKPEGDGAMAAGTGPEWIVNVMTVTDPEVANRHLKTLVDAGYPAVLRQETVRGRGSYRIIIGGIANEVGARRVADLLVSKMGYAAAWPLQKR